VTLALNILLFVGIALVPLGLAILFIRLGRRWSSASTPLPPRGKRGYRGD
jgi:hypothetical protein